MNFKFQSDSINTIIPRNDVKLSDYFKFQSDSINTAWMILKAKQNRPLNSNLILLIPQIFPAAFKITVYFKFQSDSINTLAGEEKLEYHEDFKFQSDSINTPGSPFQGIFIFSNFKFQSDSINTMSDFFIFFG